MNLTHLFLSGEEITVERYMEKYNLVKKTAQRDIYEYQTIAYNTIGLIIDVDHTIGGWTYKANNSKYVLRKYI